MPEEEAKYFLLSIINGLEHLHSKGIAHRDLKPDNMFLTKDRTLKIGDFGTCKLESTNCKALKFLIQKREDKLKS